MNAKSQNIQNNLDKLTRLLKQTPDATHVYMRSEDDRAIDIPIAQAEFTIRNRPDWVVENVAVSGVALPTTQNPWQGTKKEEAAAPDAPVVVPPKPSEEGNPGPTAPVTDAPGVTGPNAAAPDAPVAPLHKYKVLKGFELAGGTKFKKGAVIGLGADIAEGHVAAGVLELADHLELTK